jgi:hypothetical protein
MAKIIGKSTTSFRNPESILRLPGEVQNALETGALPLSQGYIFVLLEVLQTELAEPATNASLCNLFKRLKATAATPSRSMKPGSRFRLSFREHMTPLFMFSNARDCVMGACAAQAAPDVVI